MSAIAHIANPPAPGGGEARVVSLLGAEELDREPPPKNSGALRFGVPNKKCASCDEMNWPSARKCKSCDADFAFKKPAKRAKEKKPAAEKPARVAKVPTVSPAAETRETDDGDPFKLPDFACGLTDSGDTYCAWPKRGDYIVLTRAQAALVAKINAKDEK